MGARWYSAGTWPFHLPRQYSPTPRRSTIAEPLRICSATHPSCALIQAAILILAPLILGMGDQFFDDVSLGIWFSLNVEWPKYLGGPKKQPLYEMNTKHHEAYHTGLDKIFSRFDGSKVWSELTPEQQKEIITSLRDYNLKFKFDQLNGTNTLDALEKTLKDVGDQLTMRQIARIQFRGNDAEFSSAWNKSDPVHRIVYGVVAIYKDHPEYRQLREAYDKIVSPRLFEWHERVDVEYSDKELSSCELLQFVVIGDAGEGGNEYSHAYEEQGLQMGCELTKYVQIADLTIDSSEFSAVPKSKVRRPCDLFRTRFGGFIVSRRFRELAISVGLPGVGFRDVNDLANREWSIGCILPTCP